MRVLRRLATLAPIASLILTTTSARAVSDIGFSVLHQIARQTPAANIAVSPLSLETALEMTRAGSRGRTASEFTSLLGGAGDNAWHEARGKRLSSLQEASGDATFGFFPANRLFVDEGERLVPAFESLMREAYQAPVERVAFKADADLARAAVNKWVASQTRDKIPELLAKGVVNTATRLVLINALYLKARWARPFDPAKTKDDQFTTPSGAKRSVAFMNSTQPMTYHRQPKFTLVAIPFAGNRLDLVVMTPNGGRSAASLLKSLDESKLSKIMERASYEPVALSMPRFSAREKYSLKSRLMALGLRSAFTDKADFSGMVTPRTDEPGNLRVAEVIHVTALDVTEEGAEGAAATAVTMTRESGGPPAPPKVVKINRAFVYAIRDNISGAILFAGQVTRP